AAGSADALRVEIDREWSGAVHRNHPLLEGLRVRRREHDREQPVLQAVLAIDVGKAARHDHPDVVGKHPPYRGLARGPRAEIMAGDENAGIAELRLVEAEAGGLPAVIPPRRAHETER